MKPGMIIAQAPTSGWLRFSDPISIVSAYQCKDVASALASVDEALSQNLCVAGFIGYEAASGLDPALLTYASDGWPLIWFGVYHKAEHLAELPSAMRWTKQLHWEAEISRSEYGDMIEKIRQFIHDGDTYQVNYTLRLRTAFEEDPYSFFVRLCQAQAPRYAIFGDLGDWVICSASPELFFAQNGATIFSRPMKGTAARGLTEEQDREHCEGLASSGKNLAENVMIVDMIRNDLGRIAIPGTVTPHPLYHVEKYPNLFQMVSTVKAQSHAPFSEIVKALFPCASITGAPKVRTMQIIHDVEKSPRHFYTGMGGYVLGNGVSQFNVLIRTVAVDRQKGLAEYGTGGGIVWDSTAQSEYEECLTKASVLTHARQEFSLFETLRFDPGTGFFCEDAHFARIASSARYWEYSLDLHKLQRQLRASVDGAIIPQRVRLVLHCDGRIDVEREDLHRLPDKPIGVARKGSCRKNDVFLYHKTTYRDVYDQALQSFPACYDVILVNEDGDCTESCMGNLVYAYDGILYTPPVSCGLLPGTFRRRLLASGEIQERRLQRDALMSCQELWIINSVREWIPVRMHSLQFAEN